MLSRILCAMVLSLSFAVGASEINSLSLSPEIQRGDLNNPQGFWPLLGVGMGLMDYNDTIRTGGVPTHVKLMGSYYFETTPWVANAGVGLHNEFLTQKGSGSNSIQSFYTEFSGRYKLSDRWQIGAIWNTLVDNPHRYHSNNDNLASFAGVEVMKEFNYQDKYLLRAGGRAMTDVGISGETIDMVMAELEVSFGGSQKIAEEKPAPQPIAPHLAQRAMMSIDLSDPGAVNFESDSTHVVSSSQKYLKRLARALADNHHLFDHLEVVGHTDQRGPDGYNQKLSLRRAQTISNTLISAGLSKSQVVSAGRGKRDLLSHEMSPLALLKNRRVQIEFRGVKNPEALKNIIDSVQR